MVEQSSSKPDETTSIQVGASGMRVDVSSMVGETSRMRVGTTGFEAGVSGVPKGAVTTPA
jgi:hypothetical protein